ncbi:MAG: hypothetical protein H0X66_15540 [Verrucomicrobia bacterium]|nr:hypothetical protein [Verrucomicrobiota bacterium]
MKTKKTRLRNGSIGLILGMMLITPTVARAAEQIKLPTPTTQLILENSETSTEPQAVVVSVKGKCDYSEDGATFTKLEEKQVLKEGVVLRTGEGARADIFFRRIGTTMRLQEQTELTIENMSRHTTDGDPVMRTLLDLKKGRIFTVVRSFVPGSTLEIRNAAGRSVVEGGGTKGRYIITADGTQVADKDSDIPLKVIGQTGVTIITPGQKFLAEEGKLLPHDPSEAVLTFIEFDELQALMEKHD